MPLVIVSYNPDVLGFAGMVNMLTYETIGKEICQSVADALDTGDDPSGRLTLDDVEIIFREQSVNELPYPDDNKERLKIHKKKAFQVIIWAHDIPIRRRNLPERVEIIKDTVRSLLPEGVGGFVWVLLAPAAFAEF